MRFEDVFWDDEAAEHIARHEVTRQEVNEVMTDPDALEAETYGQRLLIMGKTEMNRLLTVVLGQWDAEKGYVVTARPMSKKEKRLYRAGGEDG